MKAMNIDRSVKELRPTQLALTTLNLRLTLQGVFSALCWFKRSLSVFKRFESVCVKGLWA